MTTSTSSDQSFEEFKIKMYNMQLSSLKTLWHTGLNIYTNASTGYCSMTFNDLYSFWTDPAEPHQRKILVKPQNPLLIPTPKTLPPDAEPLRLENGWYTLAEADRPPNYPTEKILDIVYKNLWQHTTTKGPASHVLVTNGELGGYQIRCWMQDATDYTVESYCKKFHVYMPMAVSYRWNTYCTLNDAVPMHCVDCGKVMQGAKGGLDPDYLPKGVWWVDHCCTGDDIFVEMPRIAPLYMIGRLVMPQTPVSQRGWLEWEAALNGSSSSPIFPQKAVYYFLSTRIMESMMLQRLHNVEISNFLDVIRIMLAYASSFPMYQKSDLLQVLKATQSSISWVLQLWAHKLDWNTGLLRQRGIIPTFLNDPETMIASGGSFVHKEDKLFGDDGALKNELMESGGLIFVILTPTEGFQIDRVYYLVMQGSIMSNLLVEVQILDFDSPMNVKLKRIGTQSKFGFHQVRHIVGLNEDGRDDWGDYCGYCVTPHDPLKLESCEWSVNATNTRQSIKIIWE